MARRRWDGRPNGLQRPELAAFGQADAGRRFRGGAAGIDGTPADPFLEGGDLLGRQLAAGRHLQALVGLPYGLDEQAVFRPARHDGGPAVTTLAQARPVVQQQAAALLAGLLRMTGEAGFREQRPDLALEESHVGVGGRLGPTPAGTHRGQHQRARPAHPQHLPKTFSEIVHEAARLQGCNVNWTR
jgi:hypothetical protein